MIFEKSAFTLTPDGLPSALHDPSATLDYGFRWELPAGMIITSSVWSLDPNPVVPELVLSNPAQNGPIASVWVNVAVPVLGKTYRVTNTVTTLDAVGVNRVDARSFLLTVRRR